MTGIFLLLLFGLWVWACAAITNAVIRRVDTRRWRWPLGLAIFSLVLALPVVDEIIGGFQFRALCKKDAVLRINAEQAKGKTVRLVIKPSNQLLPGQVLTTYYTHVSMREMGTDQEIGSYGSYEIKGGWFIRTLGISESNAPLILTSSCAPDLGAHGIAKLYNFNIVNQ